MTTTKDKTSSARSVRSPVSPIELSGRIALPDGRVTEALLIWNVSDSGLGVWVPEAVASGAMVDIDLARPHALKLRAEVRWCRTVPNQPGFLIGLSVTDQGDALAAIHAAIKAASPTNKAS